MDAAVRLLYHAGMITEAEMHKFIPATPGSRWIIKRISLWRRRKGGDESA
jgi:hypothetical protein